MADSDSDEFTDMELFADLVDQFDITELNEDKEREPYFIVNSPDVDSDDHRDLNDENLRLFTTNTLGLTRDR